MIINVIHVGDSKQYKSLHDTIEAFIPEYAKYAMLKDECNNIRWQIINDEEKWPTVATNMNKLLEQVKSDMQNAQAKCEAIVNQALPNCRHYFKDAYKANPWDVLTELVKVLNEYNAKELTVLSRKFKRLHQSEGHTDEV